MAESETSETQLILNKVMHRLTPAEKWNCFVQLRETAWKIKAAAVRLNNPSWNEAQIENEVRKIFLYATT